MPYFIDSHCHLNSPKIAPLGAPTTLIQTAQSLGVAGMVTICCRMAEEPPALIDIAASHTNVWCTVGTHPHDASQPAEKAIDEAALIALAQSHPKIVGIGESGLDYFYDHSARDDQAESFRKHIRACRATGLPLVVHARDADEDVIKILKEEGAGDGKLHGVMHCFSSSAWMAEEALKLGFYLSFSGMITFKKSDALRDIVKATPLDRILVETDAPYLAPEPQRSALNQPALVVHTAKKIADIFDLTREEVADITSRNFFNLFTQARQTWQAPV